MTCSTKQQWRAVLIIIYAPFIVVTHFYRLRRVISKGQERTSAGQAGWIQLTDECISSSGLCLVGLPNRCFCSLLYDVRFPIFQLVAPCKKTPTHESGTPREHTNRRINTASSLFAVPRPLARLHTVHKLWETSVSVLLPMECDRAVQIPSRRSLLTAALRLVKAVVLSPAL